MVKSNSKGIIIWKHWMFFSIDTVVYLSVILVTISQYILLISYTCNLIWIIYLSVIPGSQINLYLYNDFGKTFFHFVYLTKDLVHNVLCCIIYTLEIINYNSLLCELIVSYILNEKILYRPTTCAYRVLLSLLNAMMVHQITSNPFHREGGRDFTRQQWGQQWGESIVAAVGSRAVSV